MKLYAINGACSQAVRITLNELGVDYQVADVDPGSKLTGEGENYLDINPNGYVPALVTEDHGVLTEVPAILQYLADAYPQAELIAENGRWERYQQQAMLNFLSSELHKAFSPFWYQPDMTWQERSSALDKLKRRLDYIDAVLADDTVFLHGEKLTVADIYAYVIISWTRHHDISITPWQNICRFMESHANRQSFSAAVAAETAG